MFYSIGSFTQTPDLWSNEDMNFTVDNDNNSNSNVFTFYKDGGTSNSHKLLELMSSTTNFHGLVLYSNEGNLGNESASFLLSQPQNAPSHIIGGGTNGGLKFTTMYSHKIQLGGENDKIGVGHFNPTLQFEIIGSDWNHSSFGLGREHAPWDHLYIETGDYGPIIKAGGADNGIDFQVGLSTTGTFGDASQNYTSKFTIGLYKVETKTPEVTLNYGTTNDTVKVSINTDAKVGHAPLTVAGAVYIGPQAEKASTGTLSKFDPQYLEKYNLWVEDGIVTEDLAFASVPQWKDEVFADDYDLITIEEVKSFIEKNKHLPEVPSEKEIKENGYTAHQMNLIFMQKIEELTLYTIEMNEQVKQLEAEIASLKNNKK